MEAVGAFFALAVGLISAAAVLHGAKTSYDHGDSNRNAMVGIRTEVTMSSERAREAGHRAAGPLLLAAAGSVTRWARPPVRWQPCRWSSAPRSRSL